MVRRLTIRKYLTVVAAQYANARQFTVDFLLQILTLPITMLILFYVFRLLLSGREALGAYTYQSLVLYYLGVTLTTQVILPAGTAMWQSWEDINKGNLVIYLSRPVDYVWYRYAKTAASASVFALCAGAIHLLVQATTSHVNLLATLQLLVALWLAYSILFMWWFLAGVVSFWWERPFTARDIIWSVLLLFSGQLIPLDLLHPSLQALSAYLPFQGIFFVPASIFAGRYAAAEAWLAMGTQAAWFIGLTVVARAAWAYGVRSYDGRGG